MKLILTRRIRGQRTDHQEIPVSSPAEMGRVYSALALAGEGEEKP